VSYIFPDFEQALAGAKASKGGLNRQLHFTIR